MKNIPRQDTSDKGSQTNILEEKVSINCNKTPGKKKVINVVLGR